MQDDVTIHDLTCVIVVAQEGSLSRAATRLHMKSGATTFCAWSSFRMDGARSSIPTASWDGLSAGTRSFSPSSASGSCFAVAADIPGMTEAVERGTAFCLEGLDSVETVWEATAFSSPLDVKGVLPGGNIL